LVELLRGEAGFLRVYKELTVAVAEVIGADVRVGMVEVAVVAVAEEEEFADGMEQVNTAALVCEH
jgi:hypothetical protein